METLQSADGTTIAYERAGTGPAVILIGGAFNDHTTVTALAETLAGSFTTYVYDRRGRGGSGPMGEGSPADWVDREVDDVAALVAQAGGSAHLFGHSSGGLLALEATVRGLPVDRLAVYEPPYLVDDSRARPGADIGDRIAELVAAGQRADAVRTFLTEAVGVPGEVVDTMQRAPMWSGLEALAHTLPYDLAFNEPGLVQPVEKLARITVPTLAIDGSESPPSMRAGVRSLADAIPGASYLTLEGQDHSVLHHPTALAPSLLDFLR